MEQDIDILRRLALMQYLGQDFFTPDEEIYYEGTEESAREEFTGNEDDFAQWCADNLTEVQPLEANDWNKDYLVLTDEEADDAWDEELERYIDDIILPDLQKIYHPYFDREKWKGDAKLDGRAHALARYDGMENEETVNDITFYIYRQN